MKKLFNSQFSFAPRSIGEVGSKAFTLIELLVVIAVLGVIAVAIVAAINPATRIKQAKDTNVKSDISQIVNALQSYYTAGTQVYPGALASLVPGELKTLPKQQGGGIQNCTSAADYSYLSNSAQLAAVWGCLFDGAVNYWCWDSTTGVLKATNTAPTAVGLYVC